jgi:hypothetical protein
MTLAISSDVAAEAASSKNRKHCSTMASVAGLAAGHGGHAAI